MGRRRWRGASRRRRWACRRSSPASTPGRGGGRSARRSLACTSGRTARARPARRPGRARSPPSRRRASGPWEDTTGASFAPECAGTQRPMGSDEKEFPPQHLDRPGDESEMTPEPQDEMRSYEGTGKLDGRVALVTGGDSGIGRAVSIAFAKEGADVAIAYLSEDEDAKRTAELVEAEGKRAITLRCDVQKEDEARRIVTDTVEQLGGLHVLVNHAGTQAPVDSPEEITTERWDGTSGPTVYGRGGRRTRPSSTCRRTAPA